MSNQNELSSSKTPVSVIIPVLNEEQNLPDCIGSVTWADEVFVVDSGSSDRSCEISRQLGAQVVQFRFQPGGPRKKNWALDNLPFRNDWVLILDADERITPELRQEIAAALADPEPHAGFYLNRKFVFLGRWIKHGGIYPSWNMRLFRREAGRYERLNTEDLATAGDVEVHEHVVLQGEAGYLHKPMLHLDYKDLSHYIDRHNRYSTWEAKMRQRVKGGMRFSSDISARFFGSPVERIRYLKRIWVRLPCRPLLIFLYRYVIRLGFLDGRPGLIFCVFRAIYEFELNCKMYEQRSCSKE